MKLNFQGLETQKWNLWIDRTQRVDEKNGVICLVTMFTPRFVVIKMSKMALCFCIFCWWQQKSVTVWEIFLGHLKDLIWLFQKMLWIIGFWAYISKMWTLENTWFWYFLADPTVFLIVVLSIISKTY